MKLIPLQDAIDAVEQEPELPGDMPTKIKNTLQKALDEKDIQLLAEVMRIVVRTTKKGIRKRILKIQVLFKGF